MAGRGMGAASRGGGCVAKGGSSKGKGMKETYPKEKTMKKSKKPKKMMGGGMAKGYEKGGMATPGCD